jgi:multidrug efflux pump subunit AcrA (membrane-fusion protein)
MFRGAGIVLALFAVVLWLCLPAMKFIKFLRYGNGNEQPDRRRFFIVTGVTTLVVICLLRLPWPGGVSAIGVVDFEPLAVHRVDSPGFVTAIHVKSGERVKPGQLLATLDNPETALELAEIELSIEESKVRSRILHRDDDVVNYQVETKKRESLERQREELAQRVDNLTIYASTEGRVIGRDLNTLVGQYLASGATLMAIGDEHKKHVELSVAQKDVDFFVRQLNSRPIIRIRGRAGVIREARLDRVNPRATRALSHPALAAPSGGPLAVRALDSKEGDTANKYQLVEPRFLASVELPDAYELGLRSGQLAKARVRAAGESIGGHLLGTVRRWMRKKLDSSPAS